jgi:hypothetical protein
MSVGKLLTYIAAGLAVLCTLLAVIVFFHEFIGVAGGPMQVVHNLEAWLMTVGYHTALIILAAAGVIYLMRKI